MIWANRAAVAATFCAVAATAGAMEWNGFADQRCDVARSRIGGLLPTNTFPEQAATTEVNLKAKVKDFEKWLLMTDLSVIGRAAERFRRTAPDGTEAAAEPSGNDRRRLWGNVAELYAAYQANDSFTVTAGKKRIVWGPGFSANPTDLLNPHKDPVDPSAERTGAWVIAAEHIGSAVTVTTVISPQVSEDVRGIWSRAAKDRYLGALRLYTLLSDTDLNLVIFHTKRFKDELANRPRLGASASKFVTNALELHTEMLMTQGRALEPDSPRVFPQILCGTRYAFANESEATAEYLYLADGLTDDEFGAILARKAGLGTFGALSPTGQIIAGRLRRNYLTLSHQRYKVIEDVFLGATVSFNADDGSAVGQASAQWQWRDDLHFSLGAFRPFEWAARDLPSEADLNPQRYRITAAARAYF